MPSYPEKVYAERSFTPSKGLTITAKLHRLGTQPAYFSLTFEERVRGRWESGGVAGPGYLRNIPELRGMSRWHLVSVKEPLHYVANTLYWFRQFDPEVYDLDSEALTSAAATCLWGLFEGETLETLANVTEEELTKYLTGIRLERLRQKFAEDMTRLFGAEAVAEARADAGL